MLERYFVKYQTVDRIRACWLGTREFNLTRNRPGSFMQESCQAGWAVLQAERRAGRLEQPPTHGLCLDT